jgi:hypothetical protein
MIDSATWRVVGGKGKRGSKSAVPISRRRPRGPRCSPTSTCCSLPCSPRPTISCRGAGRTPGEASQTRRSSRSPSPRRSWTFPSDREFLAVARSRLGHLIAKLPKQPGYGKRRARLAETIEWLTAMFAQDSPGYFDDVVLVDSTPVECGRSVDTARRSELAVACAHHHSRSHSRWFWGMRLHLLAAPDGTPRAAILASADQRNATSRCGCLRSACTAASWSSATRATPATTSKPQPASASAQRSCAPPAKTSPAAGRCSPGSASASNRSSGRSRTASASKRTERGPCPAYAHGSPPNCWPTAPASGSTGSSTAPAAASPTSPPNRPWHQPSRRITPEKLQRRTAICSARTIRTSQVPGRGVGVRRRARR